MKTAKLETLDGGPVLRFERHLAHSPEKVWRAVSEPGEMAHWFPALIETTPKAGAAMRFTFPGADEVSHGEVLEYDPPKVYAFRWNSDVLRFEIIPEDGGCVLVLTQVLGGDAGFTAARTAAGWDVCLAALGDRLDGRPAEQVDHRPIMVFYLKKWDLARGVVSRSDDGWQVRFLLDVVWRPFETVWETLTDGKPVVPGEAPPAGFLAEPASPGTVVEVDAPRSLTYRWSRGGNEAGTVHWRLVADPALATYVEVTHTLSQADDVDPVSSSWQHHLERLFSTLLGVEHEPSTPD